MYENTTHIVPLYLLTPIAFPSTHFGCGAPGDEAAGEVEHREVKVGAFLPAGEDATEAVQPGVGALDDPAAGAEAGLALDCLGFLATAADVGGEAELGGELVHLWVVVALVEAQPVRLLGSRQGPFDRIDSIVARPSLKSFRFAPAGAIPSGTPLPSVRSDRFALF